MAYAPPTIGPAGLTLPIYPDILNFLMVQFWGIFGQAAYLGTDSADYQDMSVRALQASNFIQMIQAVYLSLNPQTAVGASLDLCGRLIGTARKAPSQSIALVTLTGTPLAVIVNGVVQDVNGNYWNLASPATIGIGGTVAVIATAQETGNTTANPGELAIISTPTSGWNSVTNAGAATPGEAVEPDSQYRARLLVAQTKPSISLLAGTAAALAAVYGVTRSEVYENNGNSTAGFGFVTTAGEAVTLLSGYPFDATNVGGSITINGTVYTIDTVAGPTSLALTATAGNQTAVSYSIGGGTSLGPGHSITCVVEGGAQSDIAEAIYSNHNPGCLMNGTTSVNITDPSNNGFSIPVGFDILGYVPIYVSMVVHPLTGFTSATLAAIQAAIASYLQSLGIGENVVFSELYGAALTARPNPDQPLFSIRSAISGYQVASTAGALTVDSAAVTVTSGSGIVSGQTLVGAGIPDNTTVSSIIGTAVTLSDNATATASGVPLSFFYTGTADITIGFNLAAASGGVVVVTNS